MIATWLRRLQYFAQQRQADADVRAELEFHREMRARELEASGLSAVAASMAARRAMGNTLLAREDARAVWIWPWLESIWQDGAYAARVISHQVGSSLLAVAILAVTIGLNTTFATVLNGLLLKPWPGVGHGQNVVALYLNESRSDSSGRLHEVKVFSYDHVRYLADRTKSLALIATLTPDVVRLGPAGQLGASGALLVSANFFDTLQLTMSLGRGFLAEEDRHGAPRPVVVLSNRAWKARFGSDAAIVGRSILINELPFTVVGVTSPEFGFSEPGTVGDLFLPASAVALLRPGESVGGDLVGRLAPGVGRSQAQAEINLLSQQFDKGQGQSPRTVTVTGTAFVDRPGRVPILVAAALVSAGLTAVWLIACANVGNLLLAQATVRGREIAIRLAIGASRSRVVRQLLTEGFIVALIATAAGVAVAYALPLSLLRFIAGDASARFPFDVAPDALVLGAAVAMAAASAVAFSLAPALHATGLNLVSRLNDREIVAQPRLPLRSLLLGIQVAVSVVLLTMAGTLVAGASEQARAIAPDFVAEGVSIVSFNSRAGEYDAARRQLFVDSVASSLADDSSSEYAFASPVPLSRLRDGVAVRLPGQGERDRQLMTSVEISRGYFRLLGIPILAGRDIGASDSNRSIALVNEEMARHLWPDGNGLGQTIIVRQNEVREVVGIVRSARLTRAAGPEPMIFLPFSVMPGRVNQPLPKLLLRSDSARPLEVVRRATAAFDPQMTVQAASLAETIRNDISTGPGYYGRVLSEVLGAFALMLATVGMFGVFAYAVRQRTREIGIRVALGAQPRAVVRLILLGHSRVVIGGLICGLLGAVISSVVLRSNVAVGQFNPIVHLGVGVILGCAGLAASYIPARRATEIDPVFALRCE
ncbi:MAG TPA: ABC transporter permease [Vicinamibacterales bacterium]